MDLITDAVLDRFRVDPGEKAGLAKRDTGWDGDEDIPRDKRKKAGKKFLEEGIERLRDGQERLWADNAQALLVVFQAMDAAGKDSAIKHVFSGVNPQGCHVSSFKKPSANELDQDFLWRCYKELPSRGRIGIFNRSYYEEVLIVRVHPHLLGYQRLPEHTLPPTAIAPGAKPSKAFWKQRFDSINHFEAHLARNGTRIVKFFLHVSLDEQKERFLDRLRRPEKNWKFSLADLEERERWDDYMHAYEEAITATSTAHAPWYVVPADHKWVTRAAVVEAINREIDAINPRFPVVLESDREKLAQAQAALEAED